MGLIVTSVCLVSLALSIHAPRGEVSTTIDFVMISSPLDEHKALHTWVNRQQYQMQHQQDKASRNQTERTPEPGTCTPEMTREEARSSPKPDQQGPAVSATGDLRETVEVPSQDTEVTKVEEGNLKTTDQTMIPNQIIRPRDGKLVEQPERKTERGLLFMIAPAVV